jgi:hypothetical protein
MSFKVSPASNELENIANHLYNRFYCSEAITKRETWTLSYAESVE